MNYVLFYNFSYFLEPKAQLIKEILLEVLDLFGEIGLKFSFNLIN